MENWISCFFKTAEMQLKFLLGLLGLPWQTGWNPTGCFWERRAGSSLPKVKWSPWVCMTAIWKGPSPQPVDRECCNLCGVPGLPFYQGASVFPRVVRLETRAEWKSPSAGAGLGFRGRSGVGWGGEGRVGPGLRAQAKLGATRSEPGYRSPSRPSQGEGGAHVLKCPWNLGQQRFSTGAELIAGLRIISIFFPMAFHCLKRIWPEFTTPGSPPFPYRLCFSHSERSSIFLSQGLFFGPLLFFLLWMSSSPPLLPSVAFRLPLDINF